ncbi:hypothetical protein Cgig2_030076 [Carnegiea gigantea]|uniref:Uncharacterized protein n=1 Tax=Carnegiea gigantea TaxID=171969 RepID=A0A9Q1JZC2_9CARY|nr:hypothetical protein Cgig2_030076 [Carnegiea gigantea]
MPQAVFLAMLLNDIVKLGFLRGWMIGIMELALKELRWSTFKAWGANPLASRGRRAVTQEAKFWVNGGSDWPQGPVARPSISALLGRFPRTTTSFCLHFDLAMAEKATRDFYILEVVQAVFYAMVVNEALELGVLSRDLAEHLKLWLEGLQWYLYEAWLQHDKIDLWWAQYCRRANQRAESGPVNGQEENSKLSDASPPSSDDE